MRGRRVIDLRPAISRALELGYRLFDTAEIYGTEPILRERLAASGRSGDVVLISKVWQTNHAYRHVLAACEGSIRRLGVDSLDLYLVHSPAAWRHQPGLEVDPDWGLDRLEAEVVPREPDGAVAVSSEPLSETWEAMLELRRRGWARAVGLANVEIADLDRLAAAGLEPPAAIQVGIHPLEPRREIVEYCRRQGIRVIAHSPLAGGAVLRLPRMAELAVRFDADPARLVLRWHIERGIVPVPGAHRVEQLEDDLAAVDFDPCPEALAAVDDLGR